MSVEKELMLWPLVQPWNRLTDLLALDWEGIKFEQELKEIVIFDSSVYFHDERKCDKKEAV